MKKERKTFSHFDFLLFSGRKQAEKLPKVSLIMLKRRRNKELFQEAFFNLAGKCHKLKLKFCCIKNIKLVSILDNLQVFKIESSSLHLFV